MTAGKSLNVACMYGCYEDPTVVQLLMELCRCGDDTSPLTTAHGRLTAPWAGRGDIQLKLEGDVTPKGLHYTATVIDSVTVILFACL